MQALDFLNMKIEEDKVVINDVSVSIFSNLIDLSKLHQVDYSKAPIELIEESELGKVRWLCYEIENGLLILGSVLMPSDGGYWSDWSKENEIKRKKVQDKLLKIWKIKKGNNGDVKIDNMYDPKGGFSAISIQPV